MENKISLIISFNGQEGSGKSTIAKLVAEKLGWPRYYMGQMFRDMAAEMGITLPEFRKICDADPEFDRKVDDRVVQLSQKQDKFVIESRTAWHFIPQSMKVYLKVDPSIAAERIFKALSEENSRSNEDTKLDSVESIRESILRRRKEDNERYALMYGIHQDNDENYDLIIDTSSLAVEEVLEKVMQYIQSRIQ